MATNSHFTECLAELDLQHVDRAVALLWYYRHTQEYEERSASDLAYDLHDAGFPKPNVTRLESDLRKSKFTVRGRRKETFQIDIRKLGKLSDKYLPLLSKKEIKVDDNILPSEWFAGTRRYLEQIVLQINGSYQFGFHDCCAVLCRRLMESLIIEVYIKQGRQHEIQVAGVFLGLDKLIAHIKSDKVITLGRNSPGTMDDLKQIGDTAAHDRTYITQPIDINDIKSKYRRLISELLSLSGIRS